jgi:hypothetical protein
MRSHHSQATAKKSVSAGVKRKTGPSPTENSAPKRVHSTPSSRRASSPLTDGGPALASSSQPIAGSVAPTGEAERSARRSTVEIIIDDDAGGSTNPRAGHSEHDESDTESSEAELGESSPCLATCESCI